MTTPVWEPRFEDALRPCLAPEASDAVLEADTSLRDMGLDSLKTVELVVRIEDAFDVVFPDEALTFETFATPQALWAVVQGLLEPTEVSS